MKYLGRYISRLLGRSLTRAFIALPSCIVDNTVAWFKNLNTIISEGGSDSIEGLLDFDGVDDYVLFNGLPSGLDPNGANISGTITFKAYIDSDNVSNRKNYITFVGDASTQRFTVIAFDPTLSTYGSIVVSYVSFEDSSEGCLLLESHLNTVLTITIDFDRNNTAININGDDLVIVNPLGTLPGNSLSIVDLDNVIYIGQYPESTTAIFGEGVYIWDVQYESSWQVQGQPNGNTNTAWEDTINSLDGTVYGSPTTTNVEGTVTVDYTKDSIGDRTDTVYYGQYLDTTSGQINFYRTSGTFDYTDPSDGSLVEDVTIPGTGLYTIPANGICDIVTSDGSEYPVCESAGEVLHDVNENSVHISVDTPVWFEGLYGSDYLNQSGYVDKDDFIDAGYDFETIVDGVTETLNDNCLIPLKQE